MEEFDVICEKNVSEKNLQDGLTRNNPFIPSTNRKERMPSFGFYALRFTRFHYDVARFLCGVHRLLARGVLPQTWPLRSWCLESLP